MSEDIVPHDLFLPEILNNPVLHPLLKDRVRQLLDRPVGDDELRMDEFAELGKLLHGMGYECTLREAFRRKYMGYAKFR